MLSDRLNPVREPLSPIWLGPVCLSPVRLSPENQDLNERVRLSPAFFGYHFQDLSVTGV